MNNLLKRTIFGALYVGVIFVSVVIYPDILPFIGVFALFGMLHEFYENSIGENFMKHQRALAVIAASLCLLAACAAGNGLFSFKWCFISLLPLMAIIPVQIFSKQRFELDKLSYIFFGLVWIALPLIIIALLILRQGSYNPNLLFCFFILIWCSDVGAYCLGSLLGQKPGARKLAPRISPKKSWWGVAGGVILCIIVAVVLNGFDYLEFPLIHTIILSILISISSVFGDLFESLWKRHVGIKDSGNLIPGHGGLLDRLDSSLVAIPLGYIYLTLFNLI